MANSTAGWDHPEPGDEIRAQMGLGSAGSSSPAPTPRPVRAAGDPRSVMRLLRTPFGADPGSRLWLYFGYDGRIGRATYWLGWLILYAASFVGLLVLAVIDALVRAALGPSTLWFGIALIVVYYAVLVLANIGLWCKRWHDRGKSGWWSLIVIIPILGALWIVIELGILAGTPGPNRYGPSATRVFSP